MYKKQLVFIIIACTILPCRAQEDQWSCLLNYSTKVKNEMLHQPDAFVTGLLLGTTLHAADLQEIKTGTLFGLAENTKLPFVGTASNFFTVQTPVPLHFYQKIPHTVMVLGVYGAHNARADIEKFFKIEKPLEQPDFVVRTGAQAANITVGMVVAYVVFSVINSALKN